MTYIDLRSDTVTKPTPAMRAAMSTAEVGDDIYGEDPTTNELEARAAQLLGKEAAIFVPTGCMGNTIGVKLNTQHGDEVICDARGHLIDWELSMTAWFSGCLVRTVPTPDGILTWDRLSPYIRRTSPHNSPTACIEIENTHNMAGGVPYPVEVIDDVCKRAHELGIKVHMDGARVFNAAAAQNLPVSRLVRDVDTVMFCLSKGLCAPVGSMVVSTKANIDRARRYRKQLGGGMRQVGVLAAAGLLALNDMPARLHEDHANAAFLAQGMAQLGYDCGRVETNIVIFDLGQRMQVTELLDRLKTRVVLAGGAGCTRVRFVTHHDVTRADCETALAATRESLA